MSCTLMGGISFFCDGEREVGEERRRERIWRLGFRNLLVLIIPISAIVVGSAQTQHAMYTRSHISYVINYLFSFGLLHPPTHPPIMTINDLSVFGVSNLI